MQPQLKMELPNGSVLEADETGDEEFPGLCITVDGIIAAVVEWHSEYKEIVVRMYVSEEAYEAKEDFDQEPVAYFSWKTGHPLPT